jgi:mRNA-degrading endonuclease RelE of RelBE toxin-antitoxin system
MDDEYILKPSKFFLDQVEELSDKAARIVEEKLMLLKINPFRNKRLYGINLFLFRIRFEDGRKEKRIVYLVDNPEVKLICILNRDSGYKKLRKYLKQLGYL